MELTYHASTRRCAHDRCLHPAVATAKFCAAHLRAHLTATADDPDPPRKAVLDRVAREESLAGMNLAGARLAGLELVKADLQGANLRGADLSRAILKGACLRRARLEGADLSGADLQGADLQLAILGAARLEGAQLSGADLSRANLVGTLARGVIARGAEFYYSRPGGADFANADLSGANLERAVFRAADLRGAILAGASGKPILDRALLDGPSPTTARRVDGQDGQDGQDGRVDSVSSSSSSSSSSSWRPLDAPGAWQVGPPIVFRPFLLPHVNETNVYVIGCPETRRAALIDAGGFERAVVEYVQRAGLKVETIFITHAHYDHTGGLGRYLEAFEGAAVFAARPLPGAATRVVKGGDTLRIGQLTAKVCDLSGHTDDSIGLLAGPVAFTGDALFAGSIGGVDGETNRARECGHIRAAIFTLPDATELYSGHGPGTTVFIEKNHNPFFTHGA